MNHACPVCDHAAHKAAGGLIHWICPAADHHFAPFVVAHGEDPATWEGQRKRDGSHVCPDGACQKPLVRQGRVLVCDAHPTDLGAVFGVDVDLPFYWLPMNARQYPAWMGELPPYASHSSMTTAAGCLKRYRLKYLDRVPDPSGWHALIGSHVHRTLELGAADVRGEFQLEDWEWEVHLRTAMGEIEAEPDFLDSLPPDQRDPFTGELTDEGREAWLDEARTRLMRLVGWLREHGRKLVKSELRLEVDLGGVPFVAVIDRVEQARYAAPLRVVDWKSGSPGDPKYRADYRAKMFQPVLYAAAYEEATGQPIAETTLVYAHPQLEEVDVALGDNRRAAIDWLRHTYDDVQAAFESKDWPAKPKPLCAWCPYVDRCEEGQRLVSILARKKGGWAKWHESPAYQQYSGLPVHKQPSGLREALAA